MDLYPAFDVRERLLDALARVGARVGWDAFVANPILTPEPRWFPDPWSPDRRGVRRLSTRLLRYVALDYDVAVTVEAPPEAHVAAWFSGLDDDTCYFGIDPRELEREDGFVAALCHETSHAFRRHHGVELRDHDREEEATDLTAVFVGFGIFLLNASDQFETSGAVVGGTAVTTTYSARLGYLSPLALSFLLAVQMIVRGASASELRSIASHLRPNQRASFEKALKELVDSRAFLLSRLAISDPQTWPAPRTEPVLVDLGINDEDDDEEDHDDEDHDDDNGQYVFRMLADAGDRYRVWGLTLGALVGGVLAVKAGSDASAAAKAIVTLVPATAGWLSFQTVGRRRREDTCSHCAKSLPVYEERCAACRARVVAEVRTIEEKLDLEEQIESLGIERALQSRPK
jgi:hypothetical protein